MHVMIDDPDDIMDYRIASHIVAVHQRQDQAFDVPYTMTDIQLYLKYARAHKPELTAAVSDSPLSLRARLPRTPGACNDSPHPHCFSFLRVRLQVTMQKLPFASHGFGLRPQMSCKWVAHDDLSLKAVACSGQAGAGGELQTAADRGRGARLIHLLQVIHPFTSAHCGYCSSPALQRLSAREEPWRVFRQATLQPVNEHSENLFL